MSLSLQNPVELSQNIKTGEHLVQFYEHEDYLSEIVAKYIESAIRNEEGVIIIATRPHQTMFESKLDAKKIQQAKSKGQLVMLDAAETLETFMKDGLPDPKKFHKVIGSLVESMSLEFKGVRAFGEMVNLLWSSGNFQGTIELEQLWNELGETLPFSLLCAYSMKSFGDERHGPTFRHICKNHSHVIPAEKIFDSADQLCEIASLQQRSHVLECELEKKGEFLSNTGFELRNRLTSLSLQLEMLHRALGRSYDDEIDERIVTRIHSCHLQSQRLASFVNRTFH